MSFSPQTDKSVHFMATVCVNSVVAVVYFYFILLYVCKHMMENLNVITLHIILP